MPRSHRRLIKPEPLACDQTRTCLDAPRPFQGAAQAENHIHRVLTADFSRVQHLPHTWSCSRSQAGVLSLGRCLQRCFLLLSLPLNAPGHTGCASSQALPALSCQTASFLGAGTRPSFLFSFPRAQPRVWHGGEPQKC